MADSLARHVPRHARLVLGLSGGLDSVVLLHVLLVLRDRHPFELQAVHVHHGLSPNADDWAERCAQRCAMHRVEFRVHRVNIKLDSPTGTEAAARHARRQIFAALDADFVLTAHHQDDQAETLLLQLLRGAGPKGLAAMAELSHQLTWRAAQLRPLLRVTRADLLDYACMHDLAWVEDESNLDTRYRRNALRWQVMPLLAAQFPGVSGTLGRAAALQAEAAELLDDLARLDAHDAIEGGRLDCVVLARLSAPRARNLLRHFIERHGQPLPTSRRLNEALHQLLGARLDARVRVSLGSLELWRFRGGAYLVPVATASVVPVRWQGEASVFVAGAGVHVHMDGVTGAGLKREVVAEGEVTLGVRRGGERLQLLAGGPHRSLKNLFQEHSIPPWQRQRLPLMWCNGRLVWAAGIGFDAESCAAPGEPGVLPRVEG